MPDSNSKCPTKKDIADALATLGRKGGMSTSKSKQTAARENLKAARAARGETHRHRTYKHAVKAITER